MTLANGARLGPYEILELIGRGGMGEVYRAVDGRLGRQVAIKILPPELANHPESLVRFRREARAIAALSHNNIVAIFDIGSQAETPYVVTELLDGETLRTRLERGRLPLDESLRIGDAIAEGLAAAHAKGIVHRDLKPENVFLTTAGGVKILDFGLASAPRPALTPDGVTQQEMLTEPGMVMGTIGYASPEQLRGKALTTATDVFSFGCVAYEMLLGEMPFQRDSNMETIASVLRDEAFRPDAGEQVPDEIRAVVETCLAKDPRERYQNGTELLEAWRSVMALHVRGALATARIAATQQMPRAGRTIALVVVLLVAIAGGFGGWKYVAARQEVIDDGYDLRAADITGSAETRRLTRLALRADGAGNRSEAITLLQQAARDRTAPLPAAFLSSFIYYSGDPKEGERWAAEAERRLKPSTSTYETLLCRYLNPTVESAASMSLSTSLLELRPAAWRLRLSLAHRHMDRREMPAMLEQLKKIDVSAPDDRRLALVLADRASLGDIDGAERDLQRSRLMQRPAQLGYARARIAWSRGQYARAAELYRATAESATANNLTTVAVDARVLEGASRLAAGDFAGAQATLDLAALRAHEAALPVSETEARAFGAYAAYRLGDADGVARRLQIANALTHPASTYSLSVQLFALRARVPLKPSPLPPHEETDLHPGAPTLVAAREAWSRGDLGSARALLQRARSEGVDSNWFAEEAALLDHDLGAPARTFKPDPPYPNRLRFIALWELNRATSR